MSGNIRDIFLFLLKMGLWGRKTDSSNYFPLTKEEWSYIYEISISQTVEGIVYEGVLMLPNEYYPPYEILLRWTARIDSIERYNAKVRKALGVLEKGFASNNIQFMLLKGVGLAENYIKPSLRVSGDIDLYFHKVSNYDQANNLVISKGCIVNRGDHHSSYYSFNLVEVEHHTKMIDIFNPFCQKLIQEIIDREFNRSGELDIDGRKVKIPSYLLSHVQANAHILKHYMGFGIGLRQICDVARLCYIKPQNFDGDELKHIYSKLGMSKWMDLMHNLLVKDLGLDALKLPYPIECNRDTRSVLNDVFYSGNFGFHEVRFREGDVSLAKRYHKRDNISLRVFPHILKLLRLVPTEVLWYPLNKIYTKLIGK